MRASSNARFRLTSLAAKLPLLRITAGRRRRKSPSCAILYPADYLQEPSHSFDQRIGH